MFIGQTLEIIIKNKKLNISPEPKITTVNIHLCVMYSNRLYTLFIDM